MNKKGFDERVVIWLFDIAAFVFIVYIAVSFITKTTEDTTYVQDYLSKDIGLLIETIQASPNDLEVDYRMPDKTKYDLIITGNTLVVTQHNTPKETGEQYLLSFKISEDQKVESPDVFVI